MKRFKSGPAWLTLFTGVTAYEVWAKRNGHELLTEGFRRLWYKPYGKVVIVFAVGSLNKHFCIPRLLPQCDPFVQLGKVIKEKSCI